MCLLPVQEIGGMLCIQSWVVSLWKSIPCSLRSSFP